VPGGGGGGKKWARGGKGGGGRQRWSGGAKKFHPAILPAPMRSVFCTILLIKKFLDLKGRVHCFSMQVVMNKCFLINPEKNLAQIRLVVFKKNAKNAPLIPENDVTEPKVRKYLGSFPCFTGTEQ